MVVLDAIHDLPLFVGAGLLLNLTPGADVALIAVRSAAQGFRGGAAAALGIGTGCLLHTLAAALGLSALLAASGTAFTLLRWAGAAYLVWLGIAMLRDSEARGGRSAPALPPSAGRAFGQGFVTNALNPKVALFFLAFLPQFIEPAAPQRALAFALLGGVFVVNGTLVNLGYAWALARLGGRLAGGPLARWTQRGVGALFVALGLKLALADGR